MNPQRKELEFAVKSVLNDLGIKVSMDRTQVRPAKLGKQVKHRRNKKAKKQEALKDTD